MSKDFEAFSEYGRIRRIAKSIDPYSMTFENNNKLYVALSSGQVVAAEKFKSMKDSTVMTWLNLLFTIKMDLKHACLNQ